VVPEQSPAEVYQHGRTPFLAAAFDEKSGDVTDLATFTWSFPDAKEPIVGNPAYYRFEKTGKFTVSVTATIEKDTGSDQIAVNVVEVVGTKDLPNKDDFELFMRVPGGDRLGTEVADTVEVVCRSLVDGLWPFVPFEWANTKFYQKVDGQWVFKGEDNPGIYEVADNWSSYITWDTVGDPNAPIEWKAVTYLYDMMWPPGDPDHVFPEITAYFTPNNTVVKATGDEIILHEAEDTSHTIAWNITHSDDVDPAPEFTVTVTIYDLQGNVVDTLEEEEVGLGADSMNWDEDLPEEDGIYTYRIVANHQDMLPPQGPCEDRDKSAVLAIALNEFYYFDKDVQAGTLKGVVKYTLNRLAADTVTIRFYDPDLEEYSGSALTGQDNTAGTHWSDVYTLTGVTFDQNDDPVGPISCVLFADESATDAANNRDSLPKPALQKGSTDLEYTPVGLKAVSFASASGDSNFHTVEADYGSNTHAAPHWQDNSTPPDYDADDGEEFATGADHKYPVCYRWDSAMNASCVIEAKTPWGTLQQGDVYIRGDGDGDLDFPAREAQVSAGPPVTATYPATDSTGELPAAVQRMGPFRVVWEISTDEGSTWHYAGTSENEVFVYRPGAQGTEAPGCFTNWRTVLYLATVGGGTTDASIRDATWGQFGTGSGPQNVNAWDPREAVRDYARELRYYGGATGNTTVAALLVPTDPGNGDYWGDGQCGAWAGLLTECLGVNYLPDVDVIWVRPLIDYSWMAVKEIAFANPPTYPLNDPWMYYHVPTQRTGDLGLNLPVLAGQNTAPPYNKLFTLHYIVRIGGGGGLYYDPSYGVTATDAAEYTGMAIDAWQTYDAGLAQNVWRQSEGDSSVLRFSVW